MWWIVGISCVVLVCLSLLTYFVIYQILNLCCILESDTEDIISEDDINEQLKESD